MSIHTCTSLMPTMCAAITSLYFRCQGELSGLLIASRLLPVHVHVRTCIYMYPIYSVHVMITSRHSCHAWSCRLSPNTRVLYHTRTHNSQQHTHTHTRTAVHVRTCTYCRYMYSIYMYMCSYVYVVTCTIYVYMYICVNVYVATCMYMYV